jgi:hypothetical protein
MDDDGTVEPGERRSTVSPAYTHPTMHVCIGFERIPVFARTG